MTNVSDEPVTARAGAVTVPIRTVVTPASAVPARVTVWPPRTVTEAGSSRVMPGAGGMYVNLLAFDARLAPVGLVTVTSTWPTARAGAVATSWVMPPVTRGSNIAAVPPNVTEVAVARLEPVMVTWVPAAARTVERAATLGAGMVGSAGVVMPLTENALVACLVMKDQESLASPPLPQPVPQELRIQTPWLS